MFRRRMKQRSTRVGILLLLLLFIAVFMVSCVAGTNPLWIQGLFGADIKAYAGEETLAMRAEDSAEVAEMCATLRMLVGNGTHLEPFRNSSQAVNLYRDRILNAMLGEGYLRYSGDSAASAAVAATDPQLSACLLIPAADFESTVVRLFGAGEVSNKSGEYFTYLSRSGYYTIPVEPWTSPVSIAVLSCEETANAFRLSFVLEDESEVSDSYTAYFVKRSDGSFYLRGLENA